MGSNNPPRVCNTGLELSLGSEHHTTLCHDHDVDVLDDRQENNKKKSIITSLKYDHLLPSDLTLGPMMINDSNPSDDRDQKSPDRVLHSQASSLSAVSSFSNSSASTTVVIKRDRDVISSEEAETDLETSVLLTTRVINDSINSNNTNNNQEDDQDQGSPRKKLRLTKQQSALLEDSFKEHTTLNPKQKQDLAIELNLRPRQVEVWFQNRRARTKLKQTEADYEQWKKCCETLTEENKRLQKELQELRSLRLITTPFYTPFATSPQVICPSCQRLGASAGANKPAHLISASFTASNQHSSAAC